MGSYPAPLKYGNQNPWKESRVRQPLGLRVDLRILVTEKLKLGMPECAARLSLGEHCSPPGTHFLNKQNPCALQSTRGVRRSRRNHESILHLLKYTVALQSQAKF